jgi:septum formation protein
MASNKKYNLILGSQSPRRKELLGHIDIPFEVMTSDVVEESVFDDPAAVAEDLAALKGREVMAQLRKRDGVGTSFFPFVVSADTIVATEDRIYGKPKDIDDAREMLKSLSGITHLVVTGVFMARIDTKDGSYKEKVFSCDSLVGFNPISKDILESYLKSGESLDKAGAYGIQGKGLSFIAELEGSYSNVVGFPLVEFIDELRVFLGYDVDDQGTWRQDFHGAVVF